jgi:DNA-binding transcriptional MocR family regulator
MPMLPQSSWSPTFAARTEGASGELAAILALAAGTDLISFAGGLPDPQTFPIAVLEDVSARLLQEDAATALQYSPTPGLPGLCEAFADRLEHTEGRRPAPEELMVTSGNIDAIGLLAKALVDPGDVVAVEAPTYLGAIDAFRGFQADVRGIPMDGDGIDVEAFERLCTSTATKLLYTIPDHQNPTGITMSAERRAALVDVCRQHGVLAVEDVAYRELTFTDDPLDEYMPDGMSWTRPHGGFFTWVTGPEWLDTVGIAQRAREAGVAFVPGRPFHPQRDGGNKLRLAFSLAGDDDIDEGIGRLGRLISTTPERG